MLTVSINNMPSYAKDYEYIVARLVDCELWFYGAYDSKDKAEEVAYEIEGLIVHSAQQYARTERHIHMYREIHADTHTKRKVYIHTQIDRHTMIDNTTVQQYNSIHIHKYIHIHKQQQ